MIIDWYTIMFQIINFLILVFLLRYFLYGPIIRAMDDREQKIVEREEEAERQKKEAEEESLDYRQKKEELEEQEEEIIEKAREKAEKEKRDLLKEARKEVDNTRRRWEDAFEREKETFISELRKRIGQQACSIARRCLEDLADAELEALTWDLFLKKIREMPEEERSKLKEAVASEEDEVFLQSAFEPPKKKLNKLREELQEVVSEHKAELKLSAKTDQSLVCGLELNAGGYRVSWNIDNYLDDVEERILKDFDQQASAELTGEVSGSDETGDRK
ncbi:MAG: hypothetical protein ACQESO_07760 [Bacillota bacterium]